LPLLRRIDREVITGNKRREQVMFPKLVTPGAVVSGIESSWSAFRGNARLSMKELSISIATGDNGLC
jgi:hypothetical protein